MQMQFELHMSEYQTKLNWEVKENLENAGGLAEKRHDGRGLTKEDLVDQDL